MKAWIGGTNYQIIRVIHNNVIHYAVYQVFYRDDGSVVGISDTPLKLVYDAEDPYVELEKLLNITLTDCRNFGMLELNENTGELWFLKPNGTRNYRVSIGA